MVDLLCVLTRVFLCSDSMLGIPRPMYPPSTPASLRSEAKVSHLLHDSLCITLCGAWGN
jgi:hypothetical protein